MNCKQFKAKPVVEPEGTVFIEKRAKPRERGSL